MPRRLELLGDRVHRPPRANNVSPSPFIENWNGSNWSVEPSPNVVAFGSLGGVACVRNVGCFAAGFAATNVSNDTTLQTLIEQLQVGSSDNQGLWMAGSDGGVFNLGNAGLLRLGRGHPSQRTRRGHGGHPR